MKRVIPARRRAARPVPPEDVEQANLIRWCKQAEIIYPELARIFHIPNGGLRNRIVAAKLVGQGVKAGVLDLFLPVPIYGWHGLWIEMKSLTGRPSAEQKDWARFLAGQGYAVAVCHGADVARDVIVAYMEGRFQPK